MFANISFFFQVKNLVRQVHETMVYRMIVRTERPVALQMYLKPSKRSSRPYRWAKMYSWRVHFREITVMDPISPCGCPGTAQCLLRAAHSLGSFHYYFKFYLLLISFFFVNFLFTFFKILYFVYSIYFVFPVSLFWLIIIFYYSISILLR